MFCQECGTRIETDSRFCRNCGTAVATGPTAAAAPEQAPAEQPAFEGAIASGATPEQTGDGARALELVRQAVQADMNGNLEAAAALGEDAVRADPGDARARSCLAGIYERLGRPADAVVQYEAAVALDPSNQLDRLRLRRLAPDREAAIHASSRSRRATVRWPIVAAAAAAFLVVIGVGLAGYYTLLRPKMVASRDLAMNASEDDAAILISRARGFRLTGEYDRAEETLSRALQLDPTNLGAQQLMSQIRQDKGDAGQAPTTVENPDTLGEKVFPGDQSQALGAVTGVRDALQPGMPTAATLGLPGSAVGGVPAAGGIPAPFGSPLGGFSSAGGLLPPDAAPTTVTPGTRIPSLDGTFGDPAAGLMSNAGVYGGLGNAGAYGPLSGIGGSRRPGVSTGGGGGMLPAGPGGTMRPAAPGSDVFNGSGYQGPIFPVGPGQGTGGSPVTSVRRADGNTGSIRVVPNKTGGSVRVGGSGSPGGSSEPPEDRGSRFQAEGLRLAGQGDSAGAIRALQQAQSEFQRSSSPAAALAAENCNREISRLQGR